jgi:hypothetical protein
VTLLDDVLSSLDMNVGEHVWRHAIRGLLGDRCNVVVVNNVKVRG